MTAPSVGIVGVAVTATSGKRCGHGGRRILAGRELPVTHLGRPTAPAATRRTSEALGRHACAVVMPACQASTLAIGVVERWPRRTRRMLIFALGGRAVTTLAVLGPSGYTGRLVVAECVRQGHRPILVGRDAARVRRVLDDEVPEFSHPEVRLADVTDESALQAALQDVDLVITTVGPFDRLGRSVLDAAIATGTHYVDVTGEQPFLRWALTDRDVAANEAGVVAVPAAGFDFLPGDLLAALAAGAVSWPREVHVCYTIPSMVRFARRSSAGTRRSVAGLLGSRAVALEDEELAEELPFEHRRLAWFPRPVGPRHAASIPGAEPLTVPRHVPGVRTVRTYLAMAGWQAEVAQMGANAARWSPARRAARWFLERGEGGPSEQVRTQTRWACVAEAEGRDGIGRAWAYGHDVYGLTAVAVVAVAEAILHGAPPAGVLSPAMIHQPGELLDTISARCDLRWALARPDAADPA
jgi:short subunit dehydrogenase-like uncharacterized protein